MIDTYRHKGLRAKLVEEIKEKGIKSEEVLNAIGRVPRHAFMDSSFINFSYKDQAFPIGAGQTISQPYTVAFQTELLQIKKMDKILEIGTGSGYQAAVLVELGAKVYSIERQRELFLKTQDKLPKLGYRPQLFYGDGYKGLPTYGPFDKIIITAGAEDIPEELVKQLKLGGRMVIPVGSSEQQTMKLVIKYEDGLKITNHGIFAFVPFLRDKAY